MRKNIKQYNISNINLPDPCLLIKNKYIDHRNEKNPLYIAILNSDYYHVELLLSNNVFITKDIIDFILKRHNDYVFNLICDRLKLDSLNSYDKSKLLKIKKLITYITDHNELSQLNINYINRIKLL